MIRAVPMSNEEIEYESAWAIADAKLARPVRFYRLAALRTEGGGAGAAWFPPYTEIGQHAQGFPADEVQRENANRAENQKLHRVTVPAQPSHRATFAALVRHELEHARQWEAAPYVVLLHDFIECYLLPEVARDLDGCKGGLINSIPTEIDCNAAASVYIARWFDPADVQQVRDGERRNLACSRIPPPPPESLLTRMVAFIHIYRAAAERHEPRLQMILRMAHPEARRCWAGLREGLSAGPRR